jgi:hypothetical protein
VVGWASDRIGTRAVMLVGWGGLLATSYLFYTSLPGTPASLVWHYGLVGFFVGTIATVPIASVRAFPAPGPRFRACPSPTTCRMVHNASGTRHAQNCCYALDLLLAPVDSRITARTACRWKGARTVRKIVPGVTASRA